MLQYLIRTHCEKSTSLIRQSTQSCAYNCLIVMTFVEIYFD
jgi:hypothetical protein